jgi:hypothetical protein
METIGSGDGKRGGCAPESAERQVWRRFEAHLAARGVASRQAPHRVRWARQWLESGAEPAAFLQRLAACPGVADWQFRPARTAAAGVPSRCEGARVGPDHPGDQAPPGRRGSAV